MPLNHVYKWNWQCSVFLNPAKNKLTTIPATIELCKTLVKLNISENLISSLPPSLGKLNELVEFDCHKNQLTSLPSTVGYLKNIQRLECSGNPLAEPGLSIYLQVNYSNLLNLVILPCYARSRKHVIVNLTPTRNIFVMQEKEDND